MKAYAVIFEDKVTIGDYGERHIEKVCLSERQAEAYIKNSSYPENLFIREKDITREEAEQLEHC